MARKNAIVSVAMAGTENRPVINFNVEGCDVISLVVNDTSEEVRTRAMFHGLIQKVSDAAALGKDATPSDKHAAMQSVVDRLVAGDWNKRAGDGEGNGTPAGVIFRAFYQFAVDRATKAKKPIPSQDAVRALYDAKSRAEQLALRTIPEIATIIESLKTAKVSKVDADGLFAELDSI